jgi:hypothetical protein
VLHLLFIQSSRVQPTQHNGGDAERLLNLHSLQLLVSYMMADYELIESGTRMLPQPTRNSPPKRHPAKSMLDCLCRYSCLVLCVIVVVTILAIIEEFAPRGELFEKSTPVVRAKRQEQHTSMTDEAYFRAFGEHRTPPEQSTPQPGGTANGFQQPHDPNLRAQGASSLDGNVVDNQPVDAHLSGVHSAVTNDTRNATNAFQASTTTTQEHLNQHSANAETATASTSSTTTSEAPPTHNQQDAVTRQRNAEIARQLETHSRANKAHGLRLDMTKPNIQHPTNAKKTFEELFETLSPSFKHYLDGAVDEAKNPVTNDIIPTIKPLYDNEIDLEVKNRHKRQASDFPDFAWKRKIADYGVTLQKIGTASAYQFSWTQLIASRWTVFEDASELLRNVSELCHTTSKEDWLNAPNVTISEAEENTQIFHESCQMFQRRLDRIVRQKIIEILPPGQDAVREHRGKRFVITGAILIIALIALATTTTATIGLAVTTILLNSKVNSLIEDSNARDIEDISLRDSLLGLSKIELGFKQNVSQSFAAVQNTQELMIDEMRRAWSVLRHSNNKRTLMTSQILYNLMEGMRKTMTSSNLIQELQQERNEYYTALVSLSAGRLPQSVVGFDRLNKILVEVESKLPPYLKLAIDRSELSKYYLLPLCSYTTTGSYIAIRFNVPLMHYEQLREEVHLYKVRRSSFPAPKAFERAFNDIENAMVTLTSPQEENNIWAFSQSSKNVTTTNLDLFTCQPHGTSRKCITFLPGVYNQPNGCLKFFVENSYKNVTSPCTYSVSAEDNYHPKQIAVAKYVLHKRPKQNYFVQCPEDVEPERIILDQRRETTLITVPLGCVAWLGHHKMYPEFLPNSLRHEFLRSSEAIAEFSLDPLNKTSEVDLFTGATMNLTQIKLVYDTSALTQITKKIARERTAIAARLERNLNQGTNFSGQRMRTTSVLLYFSLGLDAMAQILILLVVLALIRRGGWLTFLPAIVVVVDNAIPAEANSTAQNQSKDAAHDTTFFKIPDFAWPSLTDFLEVEAIAEYFRLVLGLAAILLVFYFSFYRVTLLFNHQCQSQLKDARWWLQLDFNVSKHSLRGLQEHLVIIRVPILNELPAATARLMVFNPKRFIIVGGKQRTLRLDQAIKFRACDASGFFVSEQNLDIHIPVYKLAWLPGSSSFDFTDTCHALCDVSAIADWRPLQL